MKKTFLILFSLLISGSLFAQVQTVITGRVNNKPDKPVILLVYNFNTTTMQEEETTQSAKIQADSTFTISTDKVVRPYTRCRLGFRNEGQEITLSPGDTLQTRFGYGAMDTTMELFGKTSLLNIYLKEYQLNFSIKRKNNFFLKNISARDSQLFKSLTDWRNEKLAFRDFFVGHGYLDSISAKRETIRIDYEYFNDLLNPGVRRSGDDKTYDNLVVGMLGNRKFSDDSDLVDFREYRNLLSAYIDYRSELTAGRQANLQERLNLINNELTGLTRTYCSYTFLKPVIASAPNNAKKELLRNFFANKSDDPALTRLLVGIDLKSNGKTSDHYKRVANIAHWYFRTLGFLVLLLALLYLIRLLLSRWVKRWDPAIVARISIYLLGLWIIINYLRGDITPENRILPIIRTLTLLAFAGIQIYWLIPVWFRKGKWATYSLFMLLISGIYCFVLLRMGHAEHLTHVQTQWLEKDSLLFIVNSWVILVPFSFLMYYINLLIKRGQGFNYLFKEKLVSIEAVVHVVLLMIILTASATKFFRYGDRLFDFFILITCLFTFYIHLLFLIPRFLEKRRLGMFLLGCLSLVMGTAVLIYLTNVFELYLSTRGMGIDIPFLDYFSKPELILLLTAITFQIIFFPAVIYKLIRDEVKEKSTGFRLFRNKEAELNQLRSQVNPHFLFNSLNTVYAFALKENNSRTAEYIAKLANLMRYLIEDMDKEKIPVQKEISYIRDYINLQAIRSSVEHRIDINNSIDEEQSIMIAPMLMIPFVENAFKHGINPNSVSELKVTFQIKDDRFQFVIENSVDKNFESFYKEKGFGIGIPNVRQRLEYIYPGKHTLSIAETGDRFIVILNIDIEEPERMARG